jgi:predicted acetyltransferase
MEAVRLVEPSIEFEEAFKAYLEDHRQANEGGEAGTLLAQGFQAYIEMLHRHAQGLGLQGGYVPYNTYWLVQGESVLGQSSLRHYLSPSLAIIGGHIGYRIRPSARRQGYGARILALTLQRARQLGLPRVLVTCDLENTASARIIQKNGGIFERHLSPNPKGDVITHYWIDLTAPSVSESIPPSNTRAVAAHQASYKDALTCQRGDELELEKPDQEFPGWVWCREKGGAAGWVPEAFIERVPGACRLLRDYSSVELSVEAGEALTLHFEESGWGWATNRQGMSGWLPGGQKSCYRQVVQAGAPHHISNEELRSREERS